MNVFIKENLDQGLLVTLNNINHYFKVLAAVGNVSIDFKAFRLKINNFEDGDYEAILTFGKITVTALPGELSVDIGSAVSAVCDSKTVKLYINKGYQFNNFIDNAAVSVNTLNVTASDSKAVFTRKLEIEAETAVLAAAELIIKGGGSLLIKASDLTIQAGNMINNVTTFSVKARDALSLSSVLGGVSIYGGTGVVISTSSKIVKPVAATMHIESDRIIGKGSVDLGRMPISVAAKGDKTQDSIIAIINVLNAVATTLSGATVEAAAAAAGGTLQGSLPAIKAIAKQIKCKDVRVS